MDYFKAAPDDGSHLLRDHQRVLTEAGISKTDYAKQAVVFTIASFPNSAPTLYWTIYELFSRPEVLAEVRNEVQEQTISGSRGKGFVLDVAALKSKCPILLSVFQETQRTRHVNPSFRKVMNDTLLDNKYLLKAGRYLQVPGNVIHTSTGIWGKEALDFDPYRFMPQPRKSLEKDASSSIAKPFVPWGAAPYLCPARQFASTEILTVCALLAIRLDLQPASGEWERVPALNFSDLSTLANPKKDVKTNVRGRQEWAGEWSLNMGESKSRISLASG